MGGGEQGRDQRSYRMERKDAREGRCTDACPGDICPGTFRSGKDKYWGDHLSGKKLIGVLRYAS